MFSINPFRCIFCGAKSQQGFDVCAICESDLPWMDRINHCQRCGINLPEAADQCGECLQHSPHFDHLIAAIEYDHHAAFLLQHLKFYHQLVHARVGGELLLKKIKLPSPLAGEGLGVRGKLPDVIIPIPLHWQRQCHRGFNQSTEIARIISKHLKIPIRQSWVKRLKKTQAQSSLAGKARQENIKEAFTLRENITLPKHIAIIDDVVTTGATVNSLAGLLKQHGAETIEVWCVARTLKH